MTDWSDIVAQHGGIVWKTVHRIVGDDHDAKDCFQEVFVDALEFSNKQAVANWPGLLKRIATARALDLLRARMRFAAAARTLESVFDPAGSNGPVEKLAERNEILDRLRTALATMPADQAEACCLRFLETMSYEQIAGQMGITVNHVGVLLHRAKATLQVQLCAYAPVVSGKAGDEA